jgi:integrase
MKLKAKAKRYTYADPELPSHYVRVQPNGSKTFVVVQRDPHNKQHWRKIGSFPKLKIDDAREIARKTIKGIRQAAPDSFEGVSQLWFKQHVMKKDRVLRSASEIERFMKQHFGIWAGRDFVSIRRKDVAHLLDKIEEENGARQADYALAVVRQIANWYATRDENYSSPIIKGMRRTSPKETERDRRLNDDEIRAVWKAATGTYGDLIKLALLTAQRREKLAEMLWSDLDGDTWTIRSEPREKGNGGTLILPPLAMTILNARPRNNDLVFAGRGGSQIGGWSKLKRSLDKRSGVTDWVFHDLRRTAKTRMSSAGVPREISERVLGHVMDGVEGVYDRHSYTREKGVALAKLATLIERTLDPVPNVTVLNKKVLNKIR